MSFNEVVDKKVNWAEIHCLKTWHLDVYVENHHLYPEGHFS